MIFVAPADKHNETMRHFYVVSYKKPKSGRLVNIAVSFPDSEVKPGAFHTHDPVMEASRRAHEIAVRRGLPEKRYLEYGLSGSLRQCVEMADGGFITAEDCQHVWHYIPKGFTFKREERLA
jgi:hypothetical protein